MASVSFVDLRIVRRLSGGAFGEVFEAVHVRSGQEFAIKVEKEAGRGQLRIENGVYRRLQSLPLAFVPRHYGFESAILNGRSTNVLILDLLGPSLESLFMRSCGRWSLKTVLQLGDLMLTRLEFLHHAGYVHRDVKPDNFAFGRGLASKQLFLIDFGLAKAFRVNGVHNKERFGCSLVGTARYASLNAHKGVEQARRDDCEALLHCLLYFHTGKLPWQGIHASTKQKKFKVIADKKASISLRELTNGLDKVFLQLFEHIRHLAYADCPDYVGMRQMLAEAMKRNRLHMDYTFDWDTQEESQAQINCQIKSQKLKKKVN